MPFSDTVPPIVYPDTYEGHLDSRRNHYEGLYPYFCPDFKKDHHLSSREAMLLRGANRHTRTEDVNLCANRNPMGDRRHNWCFRCPAGFILVAEKGTDPLPEDEFF